jgi:hypothetical protein
MFHDTSVSTAQRICTASANIVIAANSQSVGEARSQAGLAPLAASAPRRREKDTRHPLIDSGRVDPPTLRPSPLILGGGDELARNEEDERGA